MSVTPFLTRGLLSMCLSTVGYLLTSLIRGQNVMTCRVDLSYLFSYFSFCLIESSRLIERALSSYARANLYLWTVTNLGESVLTPKRQKSKSTPGIVTGECKALMYSHPGSQTVNRDTLKYSQMQYTLSTSNFWS